MTDIKNEKRYRQAISCLPQNIQRILAMHLQKLADSAQEIRLRLNRPIAVACPDAVYYITSSGGIVSAPINNSMLLVSKSDISDTFNNICNYSVYTRQNEISAGFITMKGGHRAGICGTAVINNGKIVNIRDISSMNIRISREHLNCAESLVKLLSSKSGGVLLCGAPCSGKTTVLRDMARLFSTVYSKNVALIDERGELAGTSSGFFQNDIGFCDVYDSYIKSVAIQQALRSMAPDIIICDEIGTDDDVLAIEKSVNSGVKVIASVHSADEAELKNKVNVSKLVKAGAFSTVVFLSGRNKPGEIIKIIEAVDIFGY